MAARNRRNGASAPEQVVAPESAPEQVVAPESAPEQVVAPESAPEQVVAPESAPEQVVAVDIDADMDAENILKSVRVYVDVTERALMSDGRFSQVQRELRADGTLGEYQIAVIKLNPKDRTESAQRFSVETAKLAKVALGAIGVKVLKD